MSRMLRSLLQAILLVVEFGENLSYLLSLVVLDLGVFLLCLVLLSHVLKVNMYLFSHYY